LAPVSGRGVSRAGAEVAIALAHASHAQLHLLYVSTTQGSASHDQSGEERARASQVLGENAKAAERYDVAVTTTSSSAPPEEAILAETSSIGADLIVLGVDRLQGAALDFGAMITSVLAESKVPVLVVAAGVPPAVIRSEP
jgi:nucleotide-binding universal stress UspA family protein